MGIPGFYGKWIERYARKALISKDNFNKKNIKNISNNGEFKKDENIEEYIEVLSLAVDANGLMHEAAAECYGYTGNGEYDYLRMNYIQTLNEKEATIEFIKIIQDKIIDLINEFKPTRAFIFAVDGVVPFAKIIQQRQRRFRPKDDSKGNFNSSALTPGTELMEIIHINLLKFFTFLKSKLPSIKFFYSSYRTPGEGEHKIMNIYRSSEFVNIRNVSDRYYSQRQPYGVIPKRPVNVIHGLDGDLIILSLISPLNNIHLFRKSKDSDIVLDIDSIKNIIYIKLGNNFDTTIYDFCLLMTFVGNDFLPAHPSFESVRNALDRMIDIYRNKILKIHKPIVNSNKSINRKNFFNFIHVMSSFENSFFEDQLLNEYRNNKIREDLKNSSTRGDFVEEDKKTFIPPPPFTTLLESTITSGDSSKFELEIFKEKWENNIIGWRGEETINKLKYEIDKFEIPVKSIDDVCKNYLEIFFWIFSYYFRGDSYIDWSVCYEFYFAPLFVHLNNFLTKNGPELFFDTQQEDFNFTCIHQLLCVLPEHSFDLLPEKIRNKIIGSNITDLFPKNFSYFSEGKSEHKKIALLPFPDRKRINEFLEIHGINKDHELQNITRTENMLIM